MPSVPRRPPLAVSLMVPQLDFDALVGKPLDEVLEDPQAAVRLAYLNARLLTVLYNLEAHKWNEQERRVDIERRVTLAASGFILLNYGMVSDYYQIAIEASASETTVEIHHGAFLGVVAPRVVMKTGQYCQLPCTSPYLLLRNSGANPATVVAVLTNRRMVLT